jgi:hypothetical protein
MGVFVWACAAFTCLTGIVAVANAIRANKIKHGETAEEARSLQKAHA